MRDHVYLEWLDRRIAIVRVYERAVSVEEIERGEPYIFYTVLYMQHNDSVLLKGALKVPYAISKHIVNHVIRHYKWSSICWERPKEGYMACLLIDREREIPTKVVKNPLKPYETVAAQKLRLVSAE